MNKKTAHLILAFFDIISLWVLWVGGQDFHRILVEIQYNAEIIDYINRVSFSIIGIGLPIIHFLTIIEYFFPKLIHKNSILMNWGVMVLVVGLISAGIAGSFYLTYRLKNAGYIYCRKASGISALAKSVVYTINDEVCEEVAASQRQRF